MSFPPAGRSGTSREQGAVGFRRRPFTLTRQPPDALGADFPAEHPPARHEPAADRKRRPLAAHRLLVRSARFLRVPESAGTQCSRPGCSHAGRPRQDHTSLGMLPSPVPRKIVSPRTTPGHTTRVTGWAAMMLGPTPGSRPVPEQRWQVAPVYCPCVPVVARYPSGSHAGHAGLWAPGRRTPPPKDTPRREVSSPRTSFPPPLQSASSFRPPRFAADLHPADANLSVHAHLPPLADIDLAVEAE